MEPANGISHSDHLSPAVRSFLAEEVLRVTTEQTKPIYSIVATTAARVEYGIRISENAADEARADKFARRKKDRERDAAIARLDADLKAGQVTVLTALARLGEADSDFAKRIEEAKQASDDARKLAADAHQHAETATKNDFAELARLRASGADLMVEATRSKIMGDTADARLKRESKRTRSKTAWKIVQVLAAAIFTVGAAVGTTLAAQNCGAHHSSESK